MRKSKQLAEKLVSKQFLDRIILLLNEDVMDVDYKVLEFYNNFIWYCVNGVIDILEKHRSSLPSHCYS